MACLHGTNCVLGSGAMSKAPLLVVLLAAVVGLGSLATSCKRNPPKKGSQPTASASASATYQGPTGSVEGTVLMEGDLPPTLDELASKIPEDCAEAREKFSRLFREGPGRTVADVFVAVTGYHGNVVDSAPAQLVEARGCAWDRRTIGVYAPQRLDVRSLDERAYVPELMGATTTSMLVAVPKGDAVPVTTRGVGHYVLMDAMRNFNKADVFVVRYPTFAVTGLDGRFVIPNIPVGAAKLHAFLPMAGLRAESAVTITPHASSRVSLKLKFDLARYEESQKSRPAPGPSASPSSAPSGSAR